MKRRVKVRLSLKAKLLSICIALVIFPVVIVGGLSFFQLKTFSDETVKQSFEGLEKQAADILNNGILIDREKIKSLLDRADRQVKELAVSPSLANYINTMEGANQALNGMIEKDVTRALEGLLEICRLQQDSLKGKLDSDFAVFEHILSMYGKPELSEETSEWEAKNQFSQETEKISLPVLRLGKAEFGSDRARDEFVPIVDEVQKLVGGTSTIFQKINDRGDMLRVSTNVKRSDGTRGTGTVIPAVNPDGKPNPVVSKILQGETYRGRAFVVDAWYITVYKPLLSAEGTLVGMLYEGVRERENDRLSRIISGTKFGKSGSVFVMDSKGDLIVHPRGELEGKNAASELKIPDMKDVLDNRTAGQTKMRSFVSDNKRSCLVYTYFPDWDWILCALGDWDDLTSDFLATALTGFKEEVSEVYRSSNVEADGASLPLYSRIRYLDMKGRDIVNLNLGKIEDKQGSVATEPWFAECLKLKKGEVYNSGAVLATATGKPEMRYASPVHVGDNPKGFVVLSFDWQIVWKILKGHVYGKTGYSFVINEAGVAIAHPTLDLSKPISHADPKFGELSVFVRDYMMHGKEGGGRYRFEGVDKYLTFVPLKVHGRNYSFVASCPIDEFLSLANSIKDNAGEKSLRSTWIIGIVTLVMTLFGALAGFFAGRGITRPLSRIIAGLREGSERVALASREIAQASQDQADGAAHQASSLEETSSSIEEMSSMIGQNAENAAHAKRLTTDAAGMVDEVGASMKELMEAMKEIADASEETQRIVKTIDEISFQTNLLALNAAIEAARAGEAGAGFAVVADEVRSLAMRAADAARNTAALIEGTSGRIHKGSALADKTANALRAMTEITTKMSDLIGEIAAASKEQAEGIKQINKAVSEMDRIVQRSASDAADSASNAAEMSERAEQSIAYVGNLMRLVYGGKEDAEYRESEGTRYLLPAPTERAVARLERK